MRWFFELCSEMVSRYGIWFERWTVKAIDKDGKEYILRQTSASQHIAEVWRDSHQCDVSENPEWSPSHDDWINIGITSAL